MANNELKNFANEVLEVVKNLRPEVKASVQEVRKNNGVIRIGLSIVEEREGTNISPTIYLDEMQKTLSPEEAAENVLRILDNSKSSEPVFDIDSFTDWNRAKEMIRFKLVGSKGNQELPHVDVAENLQVIFYVPVYMLEGGEMGSITVHQNHIDAWGVDVKTVYEKALSNTPKQCPETLKGMSEVLSEIIDASFLVGDADEKMFVLSNESKIFGAAALLYPDVLKKAWQQLGFFAILPSSVHEVILVKIDSNIEPDVLKSMIQEVNSEQVQPEEVLSDRPYYFNGEEVKVFSDYRDALEDTAVTLSKILEIKDTEISLKEAEILDNFKRLLSLMTKETLWEKIAPVINSGNREYYKKLIDDAALTA